MDSDESLRELTGVGMAPASDTTRKSTLAKGLLCLLPHCERELLETLRLHRLYGKLGTDNNVTRLDVNVTRMEEAN